ncbi:MAG: hypothetical protein K7J15_05900, partial [Candidatus Regiella insecticola]|nr:hypothetical protein [Candidatus Regiella insecticola]
YTSSSSYSCPILRFDLSLSLSLSFSFSFSFSSISIMVLNLLRKGQLKYHRLNSSPFYYPRKSDTTLIKFSV